MFCKKDALKDFANFTEKHLCWSLFLIKLHAWRPEVLLERNSNIAKFSRAPVPKKIFERLLLYIWNRNHKQCNLHTSQKLSILGFTKYFLTSSALQVLVPPNLYLLLRLCYLLNISNVSYSNSLNRSNGLSLYQKIEPMDNVWAQALFSKAV